MSLRIKAVRLTTRQPSKSKGLDPTPGKAGFTFQSVLSRVWRRANELRMWRNSSRGSSLMTTKPVTCWAWGHRRDCLCLSKKITHLDPTRTIARRSATRISSTSQWTRSQVNSNQSSTRAATSEAETTNPPISWRSADNRWTLSKVSDRKQAARLKLCKRLTARPSRSAGGSKRPSPSASRTASQLTPETPRKTYSPRCFPKIQASAPTQRQQLMQSRGPSIVIQLIKREAP